MELIAWDERVLSSAAAKEEEEVDVVSSSKAPPAVTGAPKVSIAAASHSCSAESSLFPMTATAYVCDALTMYLPGSAIRSTPHPTGKWVSSASPSTLAMSEKERFVSSQPGKPPPQSRIVMLKPKEEAMSNTRRALSTADAKGEGSEHPLPTWKETPQMSRPRALARERRGRHSASAAPNLELKRQTLLESSTAMRRTQRASGKEEAILESSAALSTVIRRTDESRAKRSMLFCLQGLA
mmetsp:Transcript_30438/g.71105  ORF Transcript_30438/g.71105 Transcript_30438/m.71105 type:complete len:239 (-) Transcript_30438:595-1311(-)